jgi:unsaturated rhamnogalacturonyl hydrolase
MGWYAMGIVDVLDDFPVEHPKRPELLAIFRHVIDAVVPYQDPETGVWYQVLDQAGRDGNYREASCTAMFVYAIAKGVRMGYLDQSARAVAERGFDGMIDEFVTEGPDGLLNLNHVCSVSGLGGDSYRDGTFEYYVSEPQRTNDLKGVGPFILAALELGR